MRSRTDARLLPSPGLTEAPVLDLMCSQFVLALTMKQAGRFNLRRDWSSLLYWRLRERRRAEQRERIQDVMVSG